MSSSAPHSYEVVAPAGLHAEPLGEHPLFGPLSSAGEVLYRIGSSTLRRLRTGGRSRSRSSATVVSVGNIEVGGNGKTPFAIHLLQHLRAAGYAPVYLSRAFSGVAEHIGAVTVLVAEGTDVAPASDAGVRFVNRDSAGLAHEIGDEGAMVALRCPRVPLVFARRRAQGIALAERLFRPTHIVLDDAFQTWAVARDVDIVMLDAREPFANGRLLPAGRLREAPEALGRANAIGLNGYDDSVDIDAVRARVLALCGRSVPVFGVYRDIEVVEPAGDAVARPDGAVACLSSIARPGRLEEQLTGAGFDVRLAIRYPDHYRYGAADVAHIARLLEERDLRSLVTTDKDWVKLREFPPLRGLVIARLRLRLTTAEVLHHIEKPQAVPAAF